MTYITTYTYDGVKYELETDTDVGALWKLGELGDWELFQCLDAELPEDFESELLEGPYSKKVDDED